MNVADNDRPFRRRFREQDKAAARSFSLSMKDPHDTKDIMAGFPVDGKVVEPADIVKEGLVRLSADRRQVELHLYPADMPELVRLDEPLCTLAIAFEEITPAAQGNKIPERVRGRYHVAVVPADLPGFSIAKSTGDDLNSDPVRPDVLKERLRGHRLHGGYPAPHFRSTDTEPPDIGADIKDPVTGPDIIKPVLIH
jgi:hypothetical protein